MIDRFTKSIYAFHEQLGAPGLGGVWILASCGDCSPSFATSRHRKSVCTLPVDGHLRVYCCIWAAIARPVWDMSLYKNPFKSILSCSPLQHMHVVANISILSILFVTLYSRRIGDFFLISRRKDSKHVRRAYVLKIGYLRSQRQPCWMQCKS